MKVFMGIAILLFSSMGLAASLFCNSGKNRLVMKDINTGAPEAEMTYESGYGFYGAECEIDNDEEGARTFL